MKNTALVFAGMIFLVVSALHFVRYFKAWEVSVNKYMVPVQWSLTGGVIVAALALWMFIAASRRY
jgi:hypothetical protein